ncbi:MAG: hypothetical protein ACRD4Y_10010 [Candidatus Acidiferrales bacterium]
MMIVVVVMVVVVMVVVVMVVVVAATPTAAVPLAVPVPAMIVLEAAMVTVPVSVEKLVAIVVGRNPIRARIRR